MADKYFKETFYKLCEKTGKVIVDMEKTEAVRDSKRWKIKRASNNSKYWEKKNKALVAKYLANELDGEYKAGSKKGRIKDLFKKALLEEVEFSCTACDCSNLSGDNTPLLEINHINGRDIPRSGFRENHEVLCPCCHGKVTSQARKNFA